MGNTGLISLLQLSDPTLPIGAFAHSSGLETYVQLGIVHDGVTAKEYIEEMLCQNLQFNDAAFVSMSYDVAVTKDWVQLCQLDEECTALKLPREVREASQKLGHRLLKLFENLITNELCAKYKNAIYTSKVSGHYCIAFGLYAKALKIEKEDALTAFYYNAAVGMVTNAVKLIPLGQQEGQALFFSLKLLIAELAHLTLNPDPELVGLCCPGFDIRCMQHEQLYSKLYMS
jgi:urease accessory protein